MTMDRPGTAHPPDSALVTWIDEPEARSADVAEHVGRCVACRARIGELEATRSALALEPTMPSDTAFAAQRERILAAIAGPSEAAPTSGRVAGRLGWLVPLAAAAAVAAFVLVGRDERRAPRTPDTAPDPVASADQAVSPLPLVARAREAAEEAAAALVPAEGADEAASVVPALVIDEDALDAALAAAEPLAPPVSVEFSLTTESRFADLAAEDQDAVLLELAAADFDM